MLKISRIRPYECNKSCNTLHRIQQNRVCIFLNFLRFSMQFTNFCKKGYTIEVSFCTGVLKTFHCLTDTPLVCTKQPTKSSGLAICPLAMGGGGAGPIPASRPRSRPGNGSGRVRAHLGEGWRSWLGRRSCRRGVRRRPAASAAAALGSGEEKRTDDNVRPGRFYGS
jgi:hypothetical protein